MRSMTGYGAGEVFTAGLKVTVDINTLNRKQCEISIALPREMDSLEPSIREILNKDISRGRVVVKICIRVEEGQPEVNFNEKMAVEYLAALRALAKKLGVSEEVQLKDILGLPGVIEGRAGSIQTEDAWPLISHALRKALDELLSMRDCEGENLKKDLCLRIDNLREILNKIENVRKEFPEKWQEVLLKRVKQAGLDMISKDDPRLFQEVVFYVDRSDITEEITRLRSHFSQFDRAVKTDKPIGRMLDFLAQEIGREINTIASKANDGEMAALAVEFKTELEKFREQVQNVE